MHKRVLVIFPAVFLVVLSLMFSGCTSEETLPEATGAPAVSSDEVEEVSFGMWELYDTQSEAAEFICRYIEDNFRIKVTPITLSEDGYEEQIDWMIGANMLPDVFADDTTVNRFQYKVLITSGSIQAVPREIWAPLERLSAVMSWYENIYSYNGQMYFIPRTYQTFDQTHGAANVIFYRSDWAGDLSRGTFGDAAELTDIIDLLGAYRSSDTDGNSIWDTWGITGSGGMEFIWEAFLTPFGVRDWMYEDGGWIPGVISDRAKEAVSWAAQLYREGIIDPAIASQTQDEALGKFLTGQAGAVLAQAYYEDLVHLEREWETHNPDKSITKSIKIIPAYRTPEGTIHNGVSTFKSASMISSNVSEPKMQKILALFDFLFSAQGRNLMEYGSAELGAEPAKGGFLENSPEFISFANIASWNLDKNPGGAAEDSDFITYAQGVIEEDIWPWSFEEELFTDGMITPEMCVLDADDIAEEKILKLIKTTRDFDADWQSYVESMYNELNLDEAIAEVNARAEEYFGAE